MTLHHDIAVAIQTKLNGSQYLNGVYLAEVPKPTNGQYPFATISLKGGTAKFADTIRNDRWFNYKVNVYQERTATGQGPAAAEDISFLLTDEIITAFDQDMTFSGLVSMVKPVGFDASYVNREIGDTRILEFTVEARALVPDDVPVAIITPPNFALQFDGSQNYVSLGTMGNFGSAIATAGKFFCQFEMKSTTTSYAEMGIVNGSGTNSALIIAINNGGNGLRLYTRDDPGNSLSAHTSSVSPTWNDGNIHTLIFEADFVANTIIIQIDGIPQSLSYENQGSINKWSNFTSNFSAFGGATGTYYLCTGDNFQIGISSSVLYGNYKMDEGSGITTADSSGNGNTGTLEGSPLPLWVAGL